MDMFDRLEDTVNRYEDITAELGNPDVVNDQNRFRKLMKEQSSLAPLIATYTEYKNCKQTIEDSLQLLDEESDEELKELAKEELNEAKKRVEELENEIKILLLPKDPNDDRRSGIRPLNLIPVCHKSVQLPMTLPQDAHCLPVIVPLWNPGAGLHRLSAKMMP